MALLQERPHLIGSANQQSHATEITPNQSSDMLISDMLISDMLSDIILSDAAVADRCIKIAEATELFQAIQSKAAWLTPETVAQISNAPQVFSLIDQYFQRVVSRSITLQIEGFELHALDRPTIYLWEHHNHAYDSILINLERWRRGYEPAVSVTGENLYAHPVAAALMQLMRTLPFPRERQNKRDYLAAIRDRYTQMNLLLQHQYAIGIAATNGLIKQGQLSVSPHFAKFLWETSQYASIEALAADIQFVVVQSHFSHYPGEFYRARRDVMGKQPGDDIAILQAGLLHPSGLQILRFSAPILAKGMNYREFADQLTRAFFIDRPIFPEDIAAYNWIKQQQGQPLIDEQQFGAPETRHEPTPDSETVNDRPSDCRYWDYKLRLQEIEQVELANAIAQMRYGLLESVFVYQGMAQDIQRQHDFLSQACLG